MLPLLLGKRPCLNFTVTFLFNPLAGIFELRAKNSAILLIITIAFSEKKILMKEAIPFQFSSQEKNKEPDTTYYK